VGNYLNGERNRAKIKSPELLNRAQGLRARWWCTAHQSLERAEEFDAETQMAVLECGNRRTREQ
jgi:hypothetical protein